MTITKFTIIIFLTNLLFINAQEENKVLAIIGSDNITAEEFLKRWELSPQVINSKDITEAKKEFIYTLIAERLWAQEAEARNFGENNYVKYSTISMEKQFVKDALYKIEIENKVNVSHQMLSEGLRKNRYELKVKFLHSEENEEIEKLFNNLKKGVEFDSLLAERVEAKDQVESISVVFGQMEERLENVVFSLKNNAFSQPVLTSEGWLIFYIEDIVPNTQGNNKNINDDSEAVREIMQKRIADSLYLDFYGRLFKEKIVNADILLFNKLSSILTKKISKKYSDKTSIPEKSFPPFNFAEVLQIQSSFTNSQLSSPFIKFKKDPISLYDYLMHLAVDGFKVDDIENDSIKAALSSDIKKYIEGEILAREGYKRNLDKLPEVQTEVKMWRDSFLASILRNVYKDSVLVNEKFDRAKKLLISYDEIVVNDLPTVESVLAKINSGEEFVEVKNRYSINMVNSIVELKPFYELGEIGRVAVDMEVGEIYAPLKSDKGYSIIKLLEKKEKETDLTLSPDYSADSQFYSQLKTKLNNATIKFASKYRVTVNNQILQDINTSKVIMMAYRRMGFGGNIAAVPYLSPLYEWFEKMKKSKKVVP